MVAPIRAYAVATTVLATFAACCVSKADTALQHPLSVSERQGLEQRFAEMSVAELKELILQPRGFEEKRIAVHVLASRPQASDTLPALHQALEELAGTDFMSSNLRGVIRVAIANVEAQGVRSKQIPLISALLEPGNEDGTVAAAALDLQRIGGPDAAAALRANERKDAPIIRLARYHIELDYLSPEQAVQRVLAELRLSAAPDAPGGPFVAGGSYLSLCGKQALPLLQHELLDVKAKPAAIGSGAAQYERFLRDTIAQIERQTFPMPVTRATRE